MKRVFWSLAFLFLLAGPIRPAFALVSISSTSASAGPRQSLYVWPHENIVYTESGTFTGTMNLERSFDGVNYSVVVSTKNNSGGKFTGTIKNGDLRALYRWNASTVTAGSFGDTLSQTDDLVQLVPNLRGQAVLQINDESFMVNGALTASATTQFSLIQSTAPRSSTVGVTPIGIASLIWNTTDKELCISSGTTSSTWVEVSTPTTACKH